MSEGREMILILLQPLVRCGELLLKIDHCLIAQLLLGLGNVRPAVLDGIPRTFRYECDARVVSRNLVDELCKLNNSDFMTGTNVVNLPTCNLFLCGKNRTERGIFYVVKISGSRFVTADRQRLLLHRHGKEVGNDIAVSARKFAGSERIEVSEDRRIQAVVLVIELNEEFSMQLVDSVGSIEVIILVIDGVTLRIAVDAGRASKNKLLHTRASGILQHLGCAETIHLTINNRVIQRTLMCKVRRKMKDNILWSIEKRLTQALVIHDGSTEMRHPRIAHDITDKVRRTGAEVIDDRERCDSACEEHARELATDGTKTACDEDMLSFHDRKRGCGQYTGVQAKEQALEAS